MPRRIPQQTGRYTCLPEPASGRDGDWNLAVFNEDGSFREAIPSGEYWNILANGVVGRQKASGEKLYYLKDHLGSTRAVVNDQDMIVESHDYYPFGLLMPGRDYQTAERTKELFTGKERDVETGWDYFGARYYSPAIGRWWSVDPLAKEAPDMTPYHYTHNNPINRIDPDGYEDWEAFTYSAIQLSLSGYGMGLGFSGMVTSGTAEVVTLGGVSMAALPAFFLSYATFHAAAIGFADAAVNMAYALKTPDGLKAEKFKGIIKTTVEGLGGGKTVQEIAQLLVHLYGYRNVLESLHSGNIIDFMNLWNISHLTAEDLMELLEKLEKLNNDQKEVIDDSL